MQIKSATVITIIRILVQLQLHANTVLVKILFKIVEAWESYLDMERYLKKNVLPSLCGKVAIHKVKFDKIQTFLQIITT